MSFQFDQSLAQTSGQSDYIQNGGAYVVKITKAIYGLSAQKGTKFIQFSVETQDGQKANYLSIYYQNSQGEMLKTGASSLSAILGFTGVQRISEQVRQGYDGKQETYSPELEGKAVGLFLQKVVGQKDDGSPRIKFEIAGIFDRQTRKTFAEHSAGKEAKRISQMEASYSDKIDTYKPNQSQPMQNHQQGGFSGGQAGSAPQNFDSFDDDIPFAPIGLQYGKRSVLAM